MSVLVIVAHPDDETLFMGGTIAELTTKGERVQVVALSDGVGSRMRWHQWFKRWAARAERADAFKTAIGSLKAEGRLMRAFPDQRADALPQLALNKIVEGLIEEVEPYVVYTHWIGDLNLDHRRVAEAVMVATRPQATRYVRQVFSMAPEWPDRGVRAWKPTQHKKLTDVARALKLRACFAYVRELRPYPHPRSYQAIHEQTTEAFMEIR